MMISKSSDIATNSTSVLNMQKYLEEQAQQYANKFPEESYESPKASILVGKSSYIQKLLEKKITPSININGGI